MAELQSIGTGRALNLLRLESLLRSVVSDPNFDAVFLRARLARPTTHHAADAKVKKRLLWKTVAASDVEFLRVLIAVGLATPDVSANHHGWTLVHEAVDRGGSGMLLTLCAEIVGSVDLKTSSGIAPAHVAASRGDGVALVALKMLGADLTVLAADRTRLRAAERRVDELELGVETQRDQIRAAASGFMQAVGIPPRPEAAALPEAPPKPAVCCVCLDHAPNAAFLPCGHKTCCRDCAAKIAAGASTRSRPECPVCREPLADVAFVEIFES
mmetsp:Transcript_20616/g.71349  ORF Transcript_20616/g.71349 Transcript_20616/m.71349 type:complete len:271 (+) Transcript_20616:94-906(+)